MKQIKVKVKRKEYDYEHPTLSNFQAVIKEIETANCCVYAVCDNCSFEMKSGMCAVPLLRGILALCKGMNRSTIKSDCIDETTTIVEKLEDFI